MPHATPPQRKIGVFVIGARGAVGTCVALGIRGLRNRRIGTAGLVTARPLFDNLTLSDPGDYCYGGLEIRRGTLLDSARQLAGEGVVPADVVEAERGPLEELNQYIYSGFADAPDAGGENQDFLPECGAVKQTPARELIKLVQEKIQQFARASKADEVIIVNLASTEAARAASPAWDTLEGFEAELGRNANIPMSTLYAYAALDAGRPYINFTPSLGAKPRALEALARERGAPHAGCDGKTGETLMKTVLAPLFRDRNLNVLAWEGYNLLGNADGRTLADPAHKASKVANKDQALRRLLGDRESLHTRVAIDYVPSLGDWKTAWDFIHFAGFFGTRMTLQFTWSGSDSALAAPLVLDLVRLAELSHRRGEAGAMAHAAAFFKSPLGCDEHDFHVQNQLLETYVRAAEQTSK